MGGLGPNSKSIVNGIVTSSPGDLGVSSDVVLSSVRTVGSESVPVEVDEEGLLGPPPKRPLILSEGPQQEILSEPILSLTFNGVLLSLTNSDGIGDGNETGLGEGNCGLNYRLENTFLGQVGNGFGNTANFGFNDSLGMIAVWRHPVNQKSIARSIGTHTKGVFLYNNLIEKSSFRLKVSVFLLPVLELGGKIVEVMVLGDPPSLGSVV